MGVLSYDQIMRVDTAANLPTMPADGAIAFSEDTKRHYRYNNSSWDLIPTPAEVASVARRAFVNGTVINGVTPYLAKATVVSGTATLWLTNNGLSTGTAVFTAIYPEGIVINAYGSGNNYQVYNVTVASDLKSVTVQVNQMAGAVLGLVNVTTAANGIDVRGIILGVS